MPAGLQKKAARSVEGHGGVCAVALFFHDDSSARDGGKGNLREVLVPRLKPGTLQMRRPGVFDDPVSVQGYASFAAMSSRCPLTPSKRRRLAPAPENDLAKVSFVSR